MWVLTKAKTKAWWHRHEISATQEAKIEGSKLQGLSGIYNEFKASLCNSSSGKKGGGRDGGGGVFDLRGYFN